MTMFTMRPVAKVRPPQTVFTMRPVAKAPAVTPAPRRIQEGPRRAERGSSDSKLQKSCFLFNGENNVPRNNQPHFR